MFSGMVDGMDESAAVQYFLPVTIGLIMLSLGLSLQAADFRAVLARPRQVAVGLLGQLLLLPLLGFACAAVFGLSPAAAVGLVVLTGCPGGAHSNLFADLARADTALSICLTAVSSLATLVTLPLWVLLAAAVFGGEGSVSLPAGETALHLLLVVALPTLLGMAVRAGLPRLARIAEKVLKVLGVLLLLVIVAGSVAKNGATVVEHAQQVGGAVVALNLSAMAAGLALARAARLGRRAAVTVVLEVGVQNSAVAVGLAMSLLSLAHAVPAIVYSLFVYASALVVVLVSRRLAA